MAIRRFEQSLCGTFKSNNFVAELKGILETELVLNEGSEAVVLDNAQFGDGDLSCQIV